jgi:ABC-type Fe3+ transport system substrate-binding protein
MTVDRAALPGRLGQQQLSDSAGLYEAYDVAGYGIVANPSALAAAGLSAPRHWRDLASPEYARQLAMPIASKVGFSPALYDIFLQSEGWDAGWRLLSEMAGEATLLDSGFAPTASVVTTLIDGNTASATRRLSERGAQDLRRSFALPASTLLGARS